MNATHRLPRRLHLAAMALCAVGIAGAAQAQQGNVAVNTTGAAANNYAILDVSSITQGLLIPRMANLPLNPATLPQGLTVFRTGLVADRGLWAVDYGKWIRLTDGENGWDVYGNYLTQIPDPNKDFIGTTDNKPMYFKTNNLDRMRIDATTGYVGVGWPIAQPAFKERLDVNGAIRQYYLPSPGQDASATNEPGVFRYQTRGNWVGTGAYKYGQNEKLATSPATNAVNMAVLGTGTSYPLQYAAHWGKVVGTAGMVQGTNFPVVKQPRTNGWRAFENPYTELFNKSWSHFKEAVCGTIPAYSIIPSAVPTPYTMSNTATSGGANDFVTPFASFYGNSFYMRRQYLFRAEELNMELAQLNGNPNAVNGLCPGEPISTVGFWVNAYTIRLAQSPTLINLTIRSAPPGLTELNGFDNTPDFGGTISCGDITLTPWPGTAVGVPQWRNVTLSTPFTWDGMSNIIIEVAVRYAAGTADANNNPVACTNTGFNATFGANYTSGAFSPIVPITTPDFGCGNAANVATRMPDNMVNAAWTSGSSTWRPLVRFAGITTTASAAATSGADANYLHYPGALVVEDTSVTFSGIPWGRLRLDFPLGQTYWPYKGNGTISAQKGVFDNSSRLNDHVFDRAFDGRVAPSDAAHFGGERLLSINEMEAFTRENRHLPTMKGREAWNEKGGFSLGDLTNQLWATTETHALYVADLHDKLNVIEMLTNERPITNAEFKVARQDLGTMTDLTDADKARLIDDLRKRVTLTSTSH